MNAVLDVAHDDPAAVRRPRDPPRRELFETVVRHGRSQRNDERVDDDEPLRRRECRRPRRCRPVASDRSSSRRAGVRRATRSDPIRCPRPGRASAGSEPSPRTRTMSQPVPSASSPLLGRSVGPRRPGPGRAAGGRSRTQPRRAASGWSRGGPARAAHRESDEVELLGEVIGVRPARQGLAEAPSEGRVSWGLVIAVPPRASARAPAVRHAGATSPCPRGCRGSRRSRGSAARRRGGGRGSSSCRGPAGQRPAEWRRRPAGRRPVRGRLAIVMLAQHVVGDGDLVDVSRRRPRTTFRQALRTIRQSQASNRVGSRSREQLPPGPQATDLDRVVGVGLVAGDRQGQPSKPPEARRESEARTPRHRHGAPVRQGEVGRTRDRPRVDHRHGRPSHLRPSCSARSRRGSRQILTATTDRPRCR